MGGAPLGLFGGSATPRGGEHGDRRTGDSQGAAAVSPGGSEGKAQRRSSPVGSPAPSSQPLVEVDGLQLRVPLPDPSLELGLQAAHLHGAAGTRGAGDGKGDAHLQASDRSAERKHLWGVRGHEEPARGARCARPYLFCGKSAQHSGVANTKLHGEDKERRSGAEQPAPTHSQSLGQPGGSPAPCQAAPGLWGLSKPQTLIFLTQGARRC